MKFVHLADLHIGKNVHGVSMIEDQKVILKEILELVEREQPEAVLICGDVYDRPVPSIGAVNLFNDFLNGLSNIGVTVLIISGNHDSGDRLEFCSNLLEKTGVHIVGTYNGNLNQVTLPDEFGEVTFTLLPFIKPNNVRAVYPEEKIDTYNDALKAAVSHIPINKDGRNVILVHQFVTGAVTSDSEDLSIGGLDNVDANIFNGFDYVALGHIHRPQKLLRETLRYSGSPLKYSFSESPYDKWVPIVTMREKGNIEVEKYMLHPVHDMQIIKGNYTDIMQLEYRNTVNYNDYMKIILTDEKEIPGAVGRLRTAYPNILSLEYENSRTMAEGANTKEAEKHLELTPSELFNKLYKEQNGIEPDSKQKEYINKIIEEIWEGER